MRRLAALALLFWLSVLVAFIAWWKATVPRRREFPARWTEPEYGVQVDPRLAWIIDETIPLPRWQRVLPDGTVLDHQTTMRYLGHDELPHTPSNWTPGCRRCDMLQERLIGDIRRGETSVPVR